jgi:hypothetical protein
LAQSLLAAILIVGGVGGAASIYSGGGLLGIHASGDHLSNAQQQARAASFATLGTVDLAVVPLSDEPKAVESMALPPAAQVALQADLNASANANAASAQAAPVQAQAAPRPVQQPVPDALPAHPSSRRLAWVTLWDTDAEDGDVVRIDSQGYSRTVVLKKQPMTFAIPVPADGHVRITGVRDGEGGGVTVGLASGATQAILPIMSVGQVLSLNVRVN